MKKESLIYFKGKEINLKISKNNSVVSEASRARGVPQWELIRDRGQISKEIQHLERYYKEDFVSNDK